jgi:hypothetical protein
MRGFKGGRVPPVKQGIRVMADHAGLVFFDWLDTAEFVVNIL